MYFLGGGPSIKKSAASQDSPRDTLNVGMADTLLPTGSADSQGHRPGSKSRTAPDTRQTTKLSTVSRGAGKSRIGLGGLSLTILVALGGAALGSLGSQLVALITSSQHRDAAGTGTTESPGPSASATSSSGSVGLLSKAPSAAERFVEIEQALQSREFTTALLLAEEGLRLYPGDTQFNVKRQRAEEELQNRFRLQAFELAVERQNYPAALALFEEVSADSSYKTKATEALAHVRTKYIESQLTIAQNAMQLSQCAEARAFAQEVLAQDSSNQQAKLIVSECAAKQ